MEIDLEDAQGSGPIGHSLLQAEVCIVGGGIAGLVLAHRLSLLGVDTILLEAGGRRPEAASQGDRVLGGTSLRWGGQLLPALDLGGWPLPSGALDRYWAEVETLFGVDRLPYEADAFLRAVRAAPAEELKVGQAFTARFAKFAPFHRRNLASSLGRQLREHARTRVLLHAPVVEINLRAGGRCVDGVTVCRPDGRPFQVRAMHVVLAAGTFESCRLLLASRSGMGCGIGNQHGQVGRGFHDHATVALARFEGPARTLALRWGQPWLLGGLQGTLHSLKLEGTEQLRAAGCDSQAMAHFTFEEPAGSGLAQVRDVLRGRQGQAGSLLRQVRTLLRGSGDLLRTYAAAAQQQRRFLSPQAAVSLRLNVALPLSREQGIALLGMPAAGTRSLQYFDATAGERVQRCARFVHRMLEGVGLRSDGGTQWNELLLREGHVAELEDARHAMGGAAMGTDPRQSVVTPELAVHGIKTLHLASAAVLPDGRAQLPTMTLIALSLRLADRLRQELAS